MTVDLARTFAECTGRLSAEMEFQWLTGDPDADRTEARRDAMVSLLDAVSLPEDGVRLMEFRIAAKHQQSVLLTRGHFTTRDRLAAIYRRRAETAISGCIDLILS